MLRGKHFASRGDDENALKAYTSALTFLQSNASAELKSEIGMCVHTCVLRSCKLCPPCPNDACPLATSSLLLLLTPWQCAHARNETHRCIYVVWCGCCVGAERLEMKKDGVLIHELEVTMGALQEGQMDLDMAQRRLERCLAIKNLHKRMEVYKWLVALHRTQGHFEQAYKVLEEQLEVAKQIDKKAELHTMTILSDIAPLSPQGGWVKAMEIQRKVLALAQELGDQERMVRQGWTLDRGFTTDGR